MTLPFNANACRTAAAAALLLAGPISIPAQAQQDATAQEVEAYFQQIRQDAVEMIRAQELERITEWTAISPMVPCCRPASPC